MHDRFYEEFKEFRLDQAQTMTKQSNRINTYLTVGAVAVVAMNIGLAFLLHFWK